VNPYISRLAIAFLLLLGFVAPTWAQQRPQFYKTPETTAEFWAAMNHEIEIGQFGIAAGYLKGFIAKNPTDEELLDIQQREGSSAFTRLLTIPELRDAAKPLVERVDAVLQKHLSDRKRLDALIKNLSATPEERAYSIAQLRRSGAFAVPALIDALRATGDNITEHAAILSALRQMNENAIPPLLAGLDVNDPALQSELIGVLRERGAVSAVPYLWYLSASPKMSANVRRRATETLTTFLRTTHLPSAQVALTEVAERYYEHKVHFGDPERVTVWQWNGQHVAPQTLTASQAEEFYGLRFARQALDLDREYTPAQVIFLSLVLDKAVTRAGYDQPLTKAAPGVKELMTSVNPQLLMAVLQKALREHRLPVVLGAVRGLGDLAEVQAARPTPPNSPVLVQALYYGDRRVEMAAADAALRIPRLPPSLASSRVIEILRRLIAGDTAARALIVDSSSDCAELVARAVKQAGSDTAIVFTGREAIQRLADAADIDLVLVDANVVDPMLNHLLAQLRTGTDTKLVPIFVTTTSDQVEHLERQLAGYPNVWVIPAAADAGAFKQVFTARLRQTMGQPLSDVERKDYAARAMEWLLRIARGELPGYDIRPAQPAIIGAMRNKDLAPLAVEAAGRLRGRDAQQHLATLVLDAAQPEALRSLAATELVRSIQQNGLALRSEQIDRIQALFGSMPQSRLKENVALVMGTFRPDARQTGERLERYQPTFGAPPAVAPPPKKVEKESESEEKKED
jgi:CheY-like chemotaxis protein